MEINKLTNHINGQIKSTEASESNKGASKVSRTETPQEFTDKVSLQNFTAKKSEELFAKIELEKINQSSFDKVKEYKAKLQAYEAAKNESPEAAKKTEIGKMMKDPEIWSKIADSIMNK